MIQNKAELISKYTDILYAPETELNLSHLWKYIPCDRCKTSVDTAHNIHIKTAPNAKILIVAHLDRILKNVPRLFEYADQPNCVYGAYGWDDRAGVVASLELLEKWCGTIDLLFTTAEESGCVGAKQVAPDTVSQYDLIFELDRHGNADFINECSHGVLCNTDFADRICKYINGKHHRLKPCRGVYTDVGVLRQKNKTAQIFYMSCGYYNEHTPEEYLNVEDFCDSIHKADLIIDYVQTNPDILKPFAPELPTEHNAPYSAHSTQNTYSKYDWRNGYGYNVDADDTDYADECCYYCESCGETFYESTMLGLKQCPFCGCKKIIME